MIPQLRRATPDDLPAVAAADGRGFGFHYSQQDIDDFRPLFEPEQFVLAVESDGAIVGVAGAFDMTATLPGGTALASPGVTWVSVAATHLRRGILRAMMAEQLGGYVKDGKPLAMLTASQSGIYGRFGYGEATRSRYLEIDRRRVRFRADVPDPGGVRYADTDEMRKHAPEIHRRWSAITPGSVSRSEAWWEYLFLDREAHRGGASALFHLVHQDGYATYRITDGEDQTCKLVDLFAITHDAHVALWRVVLGLDLVRMVNSWQVPLDDPLPYLLDDPRQVRTNKFSDGMWTRILDVPVALSSRPYATEIDVVIDVQDRFLDRGGRFRLRGGPDGATCDAVTTTPDIALDIAELGSLLFGSARAGRMARAGRLQAGDPAVLLRFDVACIGEREANHGTSF